MMLLLTLAAAGYALYYFIKSPPHETQVVKRYADNPDYSEFDDTEGGGSNLDDCQRYINANTIRDCIETKSKRLNRNAQ
ncbi:MAG: hypothetical protein HKN85_03230 [Gammaproteobacteria bacterium]|nr:hypothetical protein [Gammaproteobacteria bacterium]